MSNNVTLLTAVLTVGQQISPTPQEDTKTQSKCGCFSELHIIIFNCAFVAVNCLLPALPSNTLLEPEGGVGQKESVGGYDHHMLPALSPWIWEEPPQSSI